MLGLTVFSVFFFSNEVFLLKTKADVSQASFSMENSYVFITPLRAAAGGQEKIRVTVFILNNQGLGVLGKRASLGPDNNLSVEVIQDVTDQFGKAVFDVSSTSKGDYYLDVLAEGQKIKQQAHLTFY